MTFFAKTVWKQCALCRTMPTTLPLLTHLTAPDSRKAAVARAGLRSITRMTAQRERERERDGGPKYNRFGSKDSWFERYKREPVRESGEQVREIQDGDERKKIIAWDVAPGQEYFEELFRVSRNQVIWGGNYFDLPPTRCFLIWRKLSISETFTMAMAEYAWTSFNSNAKVFEAAPQGKPGDTRFHPTQKPIELYAWIYKLYAKPGDKILDTHMGSQSSRIAAWDAGLDFTGYEIEPEYFNKGCERFERHTAQMNLFLMEDMN